MKEMQTESEAVVITGASAGMGLATACAFGQRGSHVGLLARGRQGLEGARQEIQAAGGRAFVLQPIWHMANKWKPRPVPPIYQPEVAADAIVWAAHHDRRELNVGISSVIRVVGGKIPPWLSDSSAASSEFQTNCTFSGFNSKGLQQHETGREMCRPGGAFH